MEKAKSQKTNEQESQKRWIETVGMTMKNADHREEEPQRVFFSCSTRKSSGHRGIVNNHKIKNSYL